jgi:Amidohydrolase
MASNADGDTLTSLFAAAGPGAGPGAGGAQTKLPAALIDMHCHVFNAMDLPAKAFIDHAFRRRYEQDGDFATLMVGLFEEITLGNAPTAAEELAAIKAGTPPDDDDDDEDDAQSEFGRLRQWLKKFNKSRRGLIAELSGNYTSTGQQCVLMTPALVDYNAWLRSPDKPDCRLDDQVKVMGAIARLKSKVRVHPLLGYDPLRAACAEVDLQTHDPDRFNPPLKPIDPISLLDNAINTHGFLGVKLYPPMGFRATNNHQGDIIFPEPLRTIAGPFNDQEFGNVLDAALDKLYAKCANDGIPILAHGYNSWGSGKDYASRASPQFWGQVVAKHSSAQKPLRLCLAHFGRFDAHDLGSNCLERDLVPQAWEVIFGNILQVGAKAAHVLTDVSYFSEVLADDLDTKNCAKRLAKLIRKFIDKYDQNVEHLCYGSDWNLLAREPNHRKYHVRLGRFLADEVGLTGEQLANVFFGNAVRFLGLRPGDQNRARLEKFYHDNNIQDQFPKIDAMA